ncbi:hypothetical protein PVMG_02282 [Plasmodium vivax Mauritania I]|uniref:Variable surface protein Vir35 n=1 Tax=Plasmodium vivax Mauritania I TaxID=1035515 RepID=A0A0J9TG33_PLAVI|nr:hypothetical protein PVMG_02282 [Plasmodium vivax Mauritania I]
MTVLKSAHSKHKVKFLVFIKIVTFIFFSCIYQYNEDENSISVSLENGNKVNISLVMRIHRLLAKHVYQNEKPTSGLQKQASYNRDNYKLEKGKGNYNTFVKLKQSRSNNVDNYLRSYKKRYSKKKGFSKLDCYFEKKVLDKIHGLYGVGEKLLNEKKSFKFFFFKKYVFGLIFFALIPSLNLIFPVLFGFDKLGEGMIDFCTDTAHKNDTGAEGCNKWHKYIWEPRIECIYPAIKVLTFIMIIIILLIVFYTLIKVVKYEKLKSGKDKMSLKEYCRFCKDVFI